MGVGFFPAFQILFSGGLVRVAFLILPGNLFAIALLWGVHIDIPGHIPGNRYALFGFPVIFGIFPNTTTHAVDAVADFFVIPPVAGFAPFICGMRHLRGSQVRKRPVDHLRGGCLLFPLLCRRDHNLIGFLFTVDTSLAHGLQIFGAHCNQGGNIHIFTRNTVLDFQLCTWFQMIAVPVSTVIFIFFQNLSHLLKSPAHGSFSGPPVPG